MMVRSNVKIGWVWLSLLAFVLVPSVLWAGDAPAAAQPKPKPHFVLNIEGERLSLVATNASLKGIVHEIGRQMNIPVATKMADRTVTTSFKGLSVVEALKYLNVNAIYFQRTEGDQKRITKIIALRKGTSGRPAAEAKREEPKPEPFKFEFDPMKVKRKAQAK